MGLCPLHHVAGVVQVLFFPALRYSPSGDPEPPLDTVRAACAHLLGPCCFLPSCPLLPSLAPLAAAGLRLLSPFSSLFTLRLSWPATQSFSEVVFFDLLFWPLVVVCLVLSGLSSCFVGVFCCCACCQPTEVTKDCRVLPAPSVHTLLIFWK